MEKKVFALCAVAIVLQFAVIAVLLPWPGLRNTAPRVSPYILSLTRPVMALQGTVTKVSGNTLTVNVDMNQGAPQPATTTLPAPAVLTYEVVVDGKTAVSRPPITVPLIFSKPLDIPIKLSAEDIKVGSPVSILAPGDLRVLGNRFTAAGIMLPEVGNGVDGKIISVSDKEIVVRAMTGIPNGPKDMRFKLTKDTEISHYDHKGVVNGKQAPKSIKYTLTDLKPQMDVFIWTDGDVTKGGDHTAVRIEPQQTGTVPPPVPTLNPKNPTP